MYGYDYEEDILLILRLLKYLHEQSPKVAHSLLETYKTFDIDAMYELTENILWEIFGDVCFDEDPDCEMTILTISHPIIDRLYELGRKLELVRAGHAAGWQRKLHDIVEFYVTSASDSIYELSMRFSGDSVEIAMHLSPDTYDPIRFANSLVDLLLYCRRECRRLEKLLGQAEEKAKYEISEEAA